MEFSKLLPETSHASKRLACLDGIRGMAILFVMASHISNRKGLFFEGEGEFGVWLFFVLSAFLLSVYFFQQPARMRNPIEWGNYCLRRFLRIYPAYALTLICGVFAHWWSWASITEALTLQVPRYWAIFVEFRYYFLLPFVVGIIHLLGKVSRALPPIAMIATIGCHFWLFPKSELSPGYVPHVDILFWEYLIVFLIGSFTAWVYVQTQHLRPLLATSRLVDILLLAAIAAPWLAAPHIVMRFTNVAADYYHLDWVPWSLLFAVLIYGTAMTDGWTRQFFEMKALRFLGFISFSLYLFMDYVLMNADRAIASPTRYVLVSVLGSAIVCTLTFLVIERPLSRISLLHPRPSAREKHN